jgi:hypothetical protein
MPENDDATPLGWDFWDRCPWLRVPRNQGAKDGIPVSSIIGARLPQGSSAPVPEISKALLVTR